MAKNPVMFVVEVGSVLTTLIWLRDLVAAPAGAAARARACACVCSTSGERPPMSRYFSADDGARRRAMSRARGRRRGPRGASMTSGSEKRSKR